MLSHALEMTGAHGAFHDFGHLAEVKHTVVRFGIYLLDRGDECNVDTCVAHAGAIGLLGAGIGAQVIGIIKLCRIYKYAHNDNIIVTAGLLHQ